MKTLVSQLTPDSSDTLAPLSTQAKAKRGPKPKVTHNPIAHLIRMAVADNMSFVDDAVMAGLYIGVGDSNGRLNVRIRHLREVICLDIISTAEILPRFLSSTAEPISERTAQYLAAGARVALGGIEHYLHRHPLLKARLQAQWDKQQRDHGECDHGDWDFALDSSLLTDWDDSYWEEGEEGEEGDAA
ncbi:hypothetical protein PS673_04549 [Pseudomonas fluorescens]|uniref:Uncharacterized protein n=1 Tax=Pseudomonas fluorescens TaxID=294 RepID=A0A5E6WB42_PSEFL|nr:hypothetical protein [Pseudomonas fluorescens]VVN25903.1 hypothetical protein PS673_04549 [Pseudomonas fluorescens]